MFSRNTLVLISLTILSTWSTIAQARLAFAFLPCGDTTDIVLPVDLTITPDNVDPSQNITISSVVNVTQTITDGIVTVTQRSDGKVIPGLELVLPMCDFLSEHWGLGCPLSPGVYSHSVNKTVMPDPFGYVWDVTTAAVNSTGGNMFCTVIVTDIRIGW